MATVTGKHFKLSKDAKRVMATLPKGQRGLFKQSMIDAEHSYVTNRTKRYKDKEPTAGDKE